MLLSFRGYLMNMWRKAGITQLQEHCKVKTHHSYNTFVFLHEDTFICVIVFPVSCAATNLTAGTVYEVAVWAHTDEGDSPTAFSRQQTKGTSPGRPSLKARALNQTSVECSWTGPPAEVGLHLVCVNRSVLKKCFALLVFTLLLALYNEE